MLEVDKHALGPLLAPGAGLGSCREEQPGSLALRWDFSGWHLQVLGPNFPVVWGKSLPVLCRGQ